MNLELFLHQVQEQNLDLIIEKNKVEIAKAKAQGLGWPSPMISFLQMRDEEQNAANGFELSQTIPFPSKLSRYRSARQSEVETQEEYRRVKEKELLAEARLVYFLFWFQQEKVNLLQEKKKILENHIKMSRSIVKSDTFSTVHLLKAELDLDFLQNEILATSQNFLQKQIEMTSLLNSFHKLDSKTQTSPTDLIKWEEPPLSDLSKIKPQEEGHRLKFYSLSLNEKQEQEREAQATWFPDLTLRYKSLAGTKMSPASTELMLGMSLPFVFYWESSAIEQKARAERMESEYELKKQKLQIENDKKILIGKLETFKKQILNLNENILPKIKKRIKLVQNLAPRDLETLQDHRETLEALPDLKMKLLTLKEEYEQSFSALMKYE